MPKAINVNPAMIKWARKDAGFSLDELPDSLKDAEKWESGEKVPAWSDLRNMAKKYKRPSFFYFLSKPPIDNDNFTDFRVDEKIKDFSSELRLEIRKAKSRRNAYLRIHENMGMQIPDFSRHLSNEKNPVKLGKYIRKYLNTDFKSQKKGNHMLDYCKELCFDLGVLVFETKDVSESEISGCSIYYDFCPIILLNGKNHHNKRLFMLMHELVHLMQKTSAICGDDKYNNMESFCNDVAFEILDTLFTKNMQELNVYRLLNINWISKDGTLYKLKNKWVIMPVNNNQIMRKKDAESDSTILMKIKQDGKSYIRLILDAYDNGIITSTQAMRYLDTSLDKIKHLETLM